MNKHCSKFPHCHCITTNQVLTCEFYVQPLGKQGESNRDWKEDFTHENGNYANMCMYCEQSFYGHKRRVVCKVCSDLRINVPSEAVCSECKIKPPCKHFKVIDKTPQQDASSFEVIGVDPGVVVNEEFGPEQVQHEYRHRLIQWLEEAKALGLRHAITFVDDQGSRSIACKLNNVRLERVLNDHSVKILYIEVDAKDFQPTEYNLNAKSTEDTSTSN